jgi:hypothetical protein
MFSHTQQDVLAYARGYAYPSLKTIGRWKFRKIGNDKEIKGATQVRGGMKLDSTGLWNIKNLSP